MRKMIQIWAIGLILVLAGCNSAYYTEEDFYSVKKIDAHVHIRTTSIALNEQAKQDNFRLLTINTDSRSTNEFISLQQNMATYHKEKTNGLVQYFSGFSIEDWNEKNWSDSIVSYLKWTFEQGAIGVKIWKNVGMYLRDADSNFVMVDDPSFEKIFRLLEESNTSLIAHCGEPKNCWLPIEEMTIDGAKKYFSKHEKYHMYLHPEYPSYEQQIQARDQMLEKYPDLHVVGAHLGSLEWSVDELAKRLDQYSNFAVDMAARMSYLKLLTVDEYDKVRQFILDYQDRLIYGTDMVTFEGQEEEGCKSYIHKRWLDDWEYLTSENQLSNSNFSGQFKGLHLPKEVVDKIFYKNAIKWLGFPDDV